MLHLLQILAGGDKFIIFNVKMNWEESSEDFEQFFEIYLH